MLMIALLSTGLCVYLLVYSLLKRREYAHSFQARTLEQIEQLGGDRAHTEARRESILHKLLQQMTASISSKVKLSKSMSESIQKELAQMGMRDKPETYVARMILAIGGGLFLGIYFWLTLSYPLPACLLLGAYAGFTLFRFSMGRRKRDRTQKIADQFPDMLDLLATSVSAGLGFSQAMQYVAEQYSGPLADEFKAVERAVSLGSTRRAALTEMADRCGLQELRTFVGAVVQADELGISLSNILNAQAKEIRLLNRLRKEEQAQKVSVKMLIPMVLFILPVLFIILLAPAVASAIQAFSGGVI